MAAGICPVDDETSGNFQCVMVGCPGGALQWRLVFAGAGEMPAELALAFTVDGVRMTEVPVTQVANPDVFDFRAPVERIRDRPLLAALKSGHGAELAVTGDGVDPKTRRVDLTAANTTISVVETVCPVR